MLDQIFNKTKSFLLGVAMSSLATTAFGQDSDGFGAEWLIVTGTTSADLARRGFELTSSSSHIIGDATEVIVTFWLNENGGTVRCVEYLNGEEPAGVRFIGEIRYGERHHGCGPAFLPPQ